MGNRPSSFILCGRKSKRVPGTSGEIRRKSPFTPSGQSHLSHRRESAQCQLGNYSHEASTDQEERALVIFHHYYPTFQVVARCGGIRDHFYLWVNISYRHHDKINQYFYRVVYSSQEPALPLHLQQVWGLGSAKVGLVYLAAVVPTIICMWRGPFYTETYVLTQPFPPSNSRCRVVHRSRWSRVDNTGLPKLSFALVGSGNHRRSPGPVYYCVCSPKLV